MSAGTPTRNVPPVVRLAPAGVALVPVAAVACTAVVGAGWAGEVGGATLTAGDEGTLVPHAASATIATPWAIIRSAARRDRFR